MKNKLKLFIVGFLFVAALATFSALGQSGNNQHILNSLSKSENPNTSFLFYLKKQNKQNRDANNDLSQVTTSNEGKFENKVVNEEVSILDKMKKVELANQSRTDEDLRAEIHHILQVLRPLAQKPYVDFSIQEIEEYNNLVRKKVVLQRILFNRKYPKQLTSSSKI
jgi:hypothetical protein